MPVVKSPFSGSVTSVCCYCRDSDFPNCPPAGPVDCWSQCPPPKQEHPCHHPITQAGSGWPGPIDLHAAVGTPVYFRASNDVASIKVLGCNICPPHTGPDNWGLKIEMYSGPNATGSLLGAVVYGHLANRFFFFQGGQVANRELYGNEWQHCQIGTVAPHERVCSYGPHIHMERQGGSVQQSSCNAYLYQGLNTIYAF
jgi:hypothetical protein